MLVTPEIVAAREAVKKARAAQAVALDACLKRPGDRLRGVAFKQADQRLGDALADFFTVVSAAIDEVEGGHSADLGHEGSRCGTMCAGCRAGLGGVHRSRPSVPVKEGHGFAWVDVPLAGSAAP